MTKKHPHKNRCWLNYRYRFRYASREAMLVNAGVNLSYNFADQFLLSGIKINSLNVENKSRYRRLFRVFNFAKELDIFGWKL